MDDSDGGAVLEVEADTEPEPDAGTVSGEDDTPSVSLGRELSSFVVSCELELGDSWIDASPGWGSCARARLTSTWKSTSPRPSIFPASSRAARARCTADGLLRAEYPALVSDDHPPLGFTIGNPYDTPESDSEPKSLPSGEPTSVVPSLSGSVSVDVGDSGENEGEETLSVPGCDCCTPDFPRLAKFPTVEFVPFTTNQRRPRISRS